MKESIEQVASGRELLMSLESEGKWLFHGSENADIDVFEPRQAHDYIDGVNIPDGDPAIFASSKADYAILMAIVNLRNCPKGYHSSAGTKSTENGEISLRLQVRKDSMERLKDDASGYVYIFDKNLFSQRKSGSVEFISSVPVSSTRKVPVIKSNLPPYVEVLDTLQE